MPDPRDDSQLARLGRILTETVEAVNEQVRVELQQQFESRRPAVCGVRLVTEDAGFYMAAVRLNPNCGIEPVSPHAGCDGWVWVGDLPYLEGEDDPEFMDDVQAVADYYTVLLEDDVREVQWEWTDDPAV